MSENRRNFIKNTTLGNVGIGMFRNVFLLVSLLVLFGNCENNDKDYYRLTLSEYQDKMKGAWVGQMAGVGWGLPTEFDYTDQMIPAEEVPPWQNEMINQHGNDDIYVEMTFLNSMDKYGLDVSIRQAGIDFANTGYSLWAANKAGRENLRKGIAPPSSSHPDFSDHCDDIDYQIEADFSGIIAPGMPNVPIEMGEKFGRLMNYGDGMYGGQFVGAMYSSAFFLDNVEEIVKAGLAAIPSESHYANCINDVINWYHQYPDSWQKTWQLIENKYHKGTGYQQFAMQRDAYVPIDAKLNGSYIVMGLLYGRGNMDSTIVISMRGGKDSDCNPSNAAGVLGTMIGFEKLDEKFKRALDYEKKFSFSEYNFNDLNLLCERFTRELVKNHGGHIDKEEGQDIFYIKKMATQPSEFHPSYQPAPHTDDYEYSEKELQQIEAYSATDFKPTMKPFGLNLGVYHCGKSIKPELITWNKTDDVLLTVPMNEQRGVRLELNEKQIIPVGKKAWFTFRASHKPGEEWNLLIRYDGVRLDTLISEKNSKNGWVDFMLDISSFAGKEDLRLILDVKSNNNKVKNYWTDFAINID